MSTATPGPERCPRCGGVFRCGAAEPGPCACATVTLAAALQAQLRGRFDGCLCLDCLRALAASSAAVADANLPGTDP